MLIFIAHASEDAGIAREIELALRESGCDVFLSSTFLEAGYSYESKIRETVMATDLMVFLVSPASLKNGCYALSELKFLESRWPSPSGHLLPVVVCESDPDVYPAYLNSVTRLKVRGNAATEVVDAVKKIAARRADCAPERQAPQAKRIVAVAAGLGMVALAGTVAYLRLSRVQGGGNEVAPIASPPRDAAPKPDVLQHVGPVGRRAGRSAETVPNPWRFPLYPRRRSHQAPRWHRNHPASRPGCRTSRPQRHFV